MSSGLSSVVRGLIRRHVRSVGGLELLTLLHEARDDRWRFAPTDAELDRATEALAEAYRREPREVVRFVFATPGRNLRRRSSAR